MLKSLFSGISGLQSHQVAMDVEANNIANVNTVGFKYSRANFSDLLAQVNQIATAPQGDSGGKNATQVGLGVTVSSMTRIFSQGSVQNSDKNTDLAIQGDGFFIVSGDGGDTLKYTRAGDFKFDSAGNFVDNNGFVVQGWLRDETTLKVDSTGPIVPIIIPPGLTTPAQATTEVNLKANLNSGSPVESMAHAYTVKNEGTTTVPDYVTRDDAGTIIPSSENMNVMFNDQGRALSLTQGQGVWMSSSSAVSWTTPQSDAPFVSDQISAITANGTLDITVNSIAVSVALVNGDSAEQAATKIAAAIVAANISGITASTNGTGNLQIKSTGASSVTSALVADTTSGTGFNGFSEANPYQSMNITLNGIAIAGNATAGGTAAQNAVSFQNMINAKTADTGVLASLNAAGTGVVLTNTNQTAGDSKKNILLVDNMFNDSRSAFYQVTNPYTGANANATATSFNNTTAYKYTYHDSSDTVGSGATKTFHTMEGFLNGMETQLDEDVAVIAYNVAFSPAYTTAYNAWLVANVGDTAGAIVAGDAAGAAAGNAAALLAREDYSVSTDVSGRIKIANSNASGQGTSMVYAITELDGSNANDYFTQNMSAMTGIVNSVTPLTSQAFNAATHASSIDIYDSLGSKHTLQMAFRKTVLDLSTGSKWDMKIIVSDPGTIDTTLPYNERTGYVKFNNDGSLSGKDPQFVSFSANNGSAGDQKVNMNFGTAGLYDGMTSFSSPSTTSGISQDGYTGGDLNGIRVDQSGTLIGSFSNGRSFGLGQVSMAKFANNEGLLTDGGNVFLQSANSGDPIRGTAATGGRGFIQSSALEASNVDLSRSLTQLIIIQKGYQANSKTISTSDQLLETLIGLKR
ncbi:MAG: flagellar hook protein FlgE [Helicobacteraceae bacterium]|nr:flagellar hook protein FlgE [Helicobacteraceae bacterium]